MIQAQTSKLVMEIQVGMLVSSWGLIRGWNNGIYVACLAEIFQVLEEKKEIRQQVLLLGE